MLRASLILSRKSGASALITKPKFTSSKKSSGSNHKKSKFDDSRYTTRFGGLAKSNGPKGPGKPGVKKVERVKDEKMRSNLDDASENAIALREIAAESSGEEHERWKAMVDDMIFGFDPKRLVALSGGP